MKCSVPPFLTLVAVLFCSLPLAAQLRVTSRGIDVNLPKGTKLGPVVQQVAQLTGVEIRVDDELRQLDVQFTRALPVTSTELLTVFEQIVAQVGYELIQVPGTSARELVPMLDMSFHGVPLSVVIAKVAEVTEHTFLFPSETDKLLHGAELVHHTRDRRVPRREVMTVFTAILKESGLVLLANEDGTYYILTAEEADIELYTDRLIGTAELEEMRHSGQRVTVVIRLQSAPSGRHFVLDLSKYFVLAPGEVIVNGLDEQPVVVVSGVAAEVYTLYATIRAVDQEAVVMSNDVIRLEHTPVDEILPLVQGLFALEGEESGDASDDNRPRLRSLTSSPRTNSLVVSGSAVAVRDLQRIVAELDTPAWQPPTPTPDELVRQLPELESEDARRALAALTLRGDFDEIVGDIMHLLEGEEAPLDRTRKILEMLGWR